MLPRTNRIPAFAMSSVLRQGSRHIDSRFHLLVTPNRQPVSRFAFVVSAKIDKRATRRNRMRRILSESVRHAYDTVQPGWDCIFLVRQNISEMKQADVEPIVFAMLKKAGVILP